MLGHAHDSSRLFTGHDPARRSRRKVLKKNAGRVGSGRVGSGRVGSGRVGSGREVLEISRVEWGRVKRFSMSRVGPGHPDTIRLVYREGIRPVKSPFFFQARGFRKKLVRPYRGMGRPGAATTRCLLPYELSVRGRISCILTHKGDVAVRGHQDGRARSACTSPRSPVAPASERTIVLSCHKLFFTR